MRSEARDEVKVHLESASAARRQRTVRMLATPNTMEAMGRWYMLYLVVEEEEEEEEPAQTSLPDADPPGQVGRPDLEDS